MGIDVDHPENVCSILRIEMSKDAPPCIATSVARQLISIPNYPTAACFRVDKWLLKVIWDVQNVPLINSL